MMAKRKQQGQHSKTQHSAPSDALSSNDIFIAVTLLALSVRFAVGLSPYSGAADPPKYGDYEAQRHWMELTVNLPVRKWYTATPTWWPLDYPPLSGYQSWLCGKAFQMFEAAAVEWDTSRGYETPTSKVFMRASVVVSDLLVLIPAAWFCARAFYPARPHSHLLLFSSLLLQPAALLIDHGHFQYNTIGLGLAAAAAAAITSRRHLMGAALFCLAMNHKQMGLFFAPAFFAHLLGRCLQNRGGGHKVLGVLQLGLVVLATFAVCWAPYLTPDLALQVLQRVLPVKRGLYEDYVANFWCATSVVIKWKDMFPQPMLIKACAAATLLASANAMLQQIRSPSARGLLMCMCNSAVAFYMFAFHVHEKSILLPLLPLTILAPVEPFWAAWAPIVASFSMFPLLVRDGVALAYCGCILLYFAVMLPVLHGGESIGLTSISKLETSDLDSELERSGLNSASFNSDLMSSGLNSKLKSSIVSPQVNVARRGESRSHLTDIGNQGGSLCAIISVLGKYSVQLKVLAVYSSVCGGVLLHVGKELVPPPLNLPWLYDRLFITLAFAHLVVMGLYTNLQQWMC